MIRFMKSFGGFALVIAVIAGLMLLSTGPGYRIGVLELRTAFDVLRWSVYGAIAATLLAVGALWRAKGRSLAAALALLVGLTTAAIPLSYLQRGTSAPPIHDITTDTANVPAFEAVVPLRATAPNKLDYSQEVGRRQREAYPELTPLILELPFRAAFDRALTAARNAGWEIVSANADTGRIEATDTTPFFGFKDDIVVRLTALGARTVVDVRSVSRVGRGDVGTNARRIREYLAAVSR